MNITFCTAERPNQISGVNTWIQNITLELKAMGHRPHILGITFGDGRYPMIEFAKKYDIDFNEIKKIQINTQDEWIRRMLEVLKSRNIDFFLPGCCFPAFFLTPYLKKASIQSILVLHSDDDDYKAYYSEFAQKLTEFRLDGVVAVSDLLFSWTDQLPANFPKQKIEYGVTVPDFQKEYGSEDKLKLVYCGRLKQEQKRILDVFDSFAELTDAYSDIECYFLGDGPDKQMLFDKMTGHQTGGIFYAGSVDSMEVQSELVKYDILVLLSDYEGLPLVLLEAMACGLVVVCLRVDSGVSELLMNGQNGIIVENRHESFIEAISNLRLNKHKLSMIGSNARQTIIDNYSTSLNAKKWLSFFSSISKDKQGVIEIPDNIDIPKNMPSFLGKRLHFKKRPSMKQIVFSALYRMSLYLPLQYQLQLKKFYRSIK